MVRVLRVYNHVNIFQLMYVTQIRQIFLNQDLLAMKVLSALTTNAFTTFSE